MKEQGIRKMVYEMYVKELERFKAKMAKDAEEEAKRVEQERLE